MDASHEVLKGVRPSGARVGRLTGRPKLVVRIVALFAVLVAAWHIFASFLWIAPVTPLRNLVPGGQSTLSSYMLPLFGQSWSVFAPAPINGNYDFKIRARMKNNSETEWISAVDVEQTMLVHNLFPPRATQFASSLASNLKGAWEKLNKDQQKKVAADYIKPDSQGRSWLFVLSDELNSQGDKRGLVDAYVAQDRRATAYATQAAWTRWGKDNVQEVQFETTRQNIIPFEQRNDPHASLPSLQVVPSGWRQPLVLSGQNGEHFSSVFEKGLNK